MKKSRLFGVLLSLVMVLGLMPGMSLTALAWEGDPYAALLNTTTTVNFDGKEWYLIENNSTAANAGTVTLLSKECVAASKYDSNGGNTYSGSTVETAVDNYYTNRISSNVKSAIVDSKMFLLTTAQASTIYNLNSDVLKCSKASEADVNEWWLCSPGSNDDFAACVSGGDGVVDVLGHYVRSWLGVRPALKLNLSSVIFDSESKEFSLKPSHTHTIGEGDSAETIEFTPWDNSTALPDTAGSYYLTVDVTLSKKWDVPEGVTNLCLDGHSITKVKEDTGYLKAFVISVNEDGSTLNLFDKEGDPGTITHAKDIEGCGVYLNGSTFNMYGGSISGNTSNSYGGVCAGDNSTFNMYDGKISGNTAEYGGGVTLDHFESSPGGTFNMYGGSIENTTGSGVFVDYLCEFNMYGGKISGNTTSNGGGVYVDGEDPEYYGTFNMYSGEISGNTAGYGGGVYGGPYGQFNMYGGEINGNTAKYNNKYGYVTGGYGGGVYEDYMFEFTMSADTGTGGKISNNNAAEAGGGVYLYGNGAVFTLTNGEISGNTVTSTNTNTSNGSDSAPDSGGGVFVLDNTFNLSGNPVISGNKLGTGDNAVDSNVYLYYDTVITLTGALTNSTPIGVTSFGADVDLTSGWSTEMPSATPTAYFTSDDPGYTVVNGESGELQLAPSHTHDFTSYTANGATITAICSAPGCTLEEHDGQYAVTLTIVKPTLTNVGEAGKSERATLEGLEEFNAATGLAVEETDVAYYTASKSGDAYTKGKKLDAAPTGAGVYLAEITLVDVGDAQSVSASVVYIIKPVFSTPDFTLPASIQTIGANAFEGASMEIVWIPDGCTAIGAEAFKGCTNLEQISIPGNCDIGEGAFEGCGTVFIFAPRGSAAESYCSTSTNCVFIAHDPS